MFTAMPLIITNTKKNLPLDTIYVKKRHNTDYGTLLKCCPRS